MTIAERYKALPRALKWGVWALALFVGYFVVVEPALDAINRANTAADDRLGALKTLAHNPGASEDETALGVRKFGSIDLPGESETRSVAFNRRVSSILEKHKVKDNSTTRLMPLGQGPLKDAYGEGERIDRLVREIQFEATPEDIAAVVSDLEKAPEVAAVSKLQIRRGDQKDTAGRVLRATLAAEAWVVNRKGRGR